MPSFGAPGAANADAKHSVIYGSIKNYLFAFLVAAHAFLCLVTEGDEFPVKFLTGIMGGILSCTDLDVADELGHRKGQ